MFFKKLYLRLYTFWFNLFRGLHYADRKAFGQTSNSVNGNTSIEVQDEQDSVYNALLRGELTQEVKELRHEMYFAERKSHEYEYAGNGRVKKKSVFSDFSDVDTEEGYSVYLLHHNSEDCGNLSENVITEEFDGNKEKRDFSFSLEMDFTPRFRLEEFAEKIVVARKDEKPNECIIDIYFSSYQKQFDRRHRMFLNEIKRIYEGDTRSEIIDFNSLSFMSFKTTGCDDFKRFMFYGFEYDKCILSNNEYILRFKCIIGIDGQDMLDEYYDEIAQKKSDAHEMRKNGGTIKFGTAIEIQEEDDYDVDSAEKLFKTFMDKKDV